MPAAEIGYAGLKDAHAVARQMLSLHGVEPAAVEALRAAIEEEKRAIREARRESAHREDEDDERKDPDAEAIVTHAQRAWPFIEMLLEAHKGQRDITWGV